MAKKVSMQTIADRLAISKYSVSQALAGKAGVSDDTRRRVLDMAEMLGYKVGTSCEPGTGAAVLLWISKEFQEELDYWTRVIDGVYAACRAAGWSCRFLGETVPPESPELPKDAAGMIVLGITPRSKLLALRAIGLPMVLVDHEDPLLPADIVLNANMEASRLACRHLISKGSSLIAFVGRDKEAVSFRERWWGCKLMLDEWKKAHPQSSLTLAKWTIPAAHNAWGAYFERRISELMPDRLPEGFVCANDRIAMTLIDSLRTKGIQVPAGCRVIGIDDIEASASFQPPLTTVFLAKEELGARAVEALRRRIANSHAVPEKVILSARLVVRQTV